MTSSARPKRRTVEDLRSWLKEVQQEERAAFAGGEGSREHRAAVENVKIVQQKLDAAVYEEERRKRLNERAELYPAEIVDEVQRRAYAGRVRR